MLPNVGKVGRVVSEEIVIQFISSKCMPILLYGVEACALTKADIIQLDFVLNRFLMKLFKTNNVQIIMACRENFSFRLPSELNASRTKKLESSKYIAF